MMVKLLTDDEIPKVETLNSIPLEANGKVEETKKSSPQTEVKQMNQNLERLKYRRDLALKGILRAVKSIISTEIFKEDHRRVSLTKNDEMRQHFGKIDMVRVMNLIFNSISKNTFQNISVTKKFRTQLH